MEPTQPDDVRADDEEGGRILATLSRIAADKRERDREAYRTAIRRQERVPEVAAENDTLPRVA